MSAVGVYWYHTVAPCPKHAVGSSAAVVASLVLTLSVNGSAVTRVAAAKSSFAGAAAVDTSARTAPAPAVAAGATGESSEHAVVDAAIAPASSVTVITLRLATVLAW